VLSHREEAWDTKEEVEDMEVSSITLCLTSPTQNSEDRLHVVMFLYVYMMAYNY
jgi:hypothetical protein